MDLSLGLRGWSSSPLAKKAKRWFAPAWRVDENGYAYANPTLGNELFVNGSFATDTNWAKGVGWTISGGVGVGTAISATAHLTQSIRPDLKPYVMTFDIVTQTAGVLQTRDSGSNGSGFTTTGAKSASRFPSQNGLAGLTGNVSAWTGTVDNLSAKQIAQVAHAGIRSIGVQRVGIKIQTFDGNHPFQLYGWSGEFPLIEAANCLRITAQATATSAFQIRLAKQVNNAFTTLINFATVTFVANALLEIRRPSGNTFQMWYNGAQVGTDVTVSDASIIDNDYFSMIALHPTTRFSEFQINGVAVPFDFK